MFLIKIPIEYPNQEKVVLPFVELSLAHDVLLDAKVNVPTVTEGDREYAGEAAINALIEELNDYYGENYNCSCAR